MADTTKKTDATKEAIEANAEEKEVKKAAPKKTATKKTAADKESTAEKKPAATAKKTTTKKVKEESAAEEKASPEAVEAPKKKTAPKKAAAKPAEAEEAKKPAAKATPKETAEEEPKAKKKSGPVLREKKKAIDKALEGDDYIEAAVSRETFSGETANKERREELAAEPIIITEDGERRAPTPRSLYEDEYQDLRGSGRSNVILTGEVIGVRQTDPDNPTSMILVDIRYKTGAFKVSIPSFLFFDYDESSFQGPQGTKDLMDSLKKRIGSTVEFVASFTKQDEGICYADRLRAMSMKGTKFYLKDWKNTGEPRIFPGIIAEGRVMAVGYQYVIAYVLGAEIRIPQSELSYLHIGDARNTFSVDQPVTVFITEVSEKNVIKRRNSYRLVNAKGSIKRCFPNEREKYYKEFSLGMLTSAEVTHIDEEMRVYVKLNGGKIDAICPWPSGNPKPIVGQKRVVKITGMDDETLRIFGMFQRT